MDEPELRVLACKWLKEHYPMRRYLLSPIVFHGLDGTITQYLLRHFKGEKLVNIPNYDSLAIRPDIIAIVRLSKNNDGETLAWIIGECKVGEVNTNDFRQAKHYADIAGAYEAYLLYEGSISNEVMSSVLKGGHIYNGINKWGKLVRKRLIFVKLVDGHFKKDDF